MSDSEDDSSNKESSSLSREQKMILVFIAIGQFFCNSCLALPAPFLPQQDEKHGVKGDLTGWIIGLSPLLQLFFCPIFGKLLPHTGLHTMFVFGLFFSGGSTILFGLIEYIPSCTLPCSSINWEYLILAFVLRGCQAVGSAAFITASMTLVSVTFTKNTTTIMGYVETVVGLGVMGGPAMGSGLYAIGGFMLTFVAVGGVMVLSSIFMYFLLPFKAGVTESSQDKLSVIKVLTNVKIVAAMILASYSGIIWASVDPILEPELRSKYRFTQQYSSLTFLLLSVAYAITAPVVGKCLDKMECLDGLSVMLVGFLLSAITFIFAGPTPLIPSLERPLWLLLLCLALLGVALGFILVPTLDLVFKTGAELLPDSNNKPSIEASIDDSVDNDNDAVNTATSSLLSGLWTSAYAFGDFAGPTISGVVTEHQSFGWTLTYYAFGCIFMIGLIMTLKAYSVIRNREKANILSVADSQIQNERTPLLT